MHSDVNWIKIHFSGCQQRGHIESAYILFHYHRNKVKYSSQENYIWIFKPSIFTLHFVFFWVLQFLWVLCNEPILHLLPFHRAVVFHTSVAFTIHQIKFVGIGHVEFPEFLGNGPGNKGKVVSIQYDRIRTGTCILSKHDIMMSSNGNIFCVTGPLCGEFAGHRCIPLIKSSDSELWCFHWSVPE